MNTVEISRALRQLRLSGMADTLETRLLEAQSSKMAPIDFISMLVVRVSILLDGNRGDSEHGR